MKSKNALPDIQSRDDIAEIVTRFYAVMLQDPIVGFIFTDVVKIELEHHLPIIIDFWDDSLFTNNNYSGNPLQKHLEVDNLVSLKPGHFTRWLYLFNQAIDQSHAGSNVELIKHRAERVAKSISAAISDRKRRDVTLTLADHQLKGE